MPEVERLFAYWQEHPPVHLLVACYLGYATPPNSRPRRLRTLKAPYESTDEALNVLAAYVGAAQSPPAHVTGLMHWAEQLKSKIGQV